MKNNMKYLVTGAAGFLGGTVCRQLIERGEAVWAFVLSGDPAMKFVPREAEIVEGDLTDPDSLEKLFAWRKAPRPSCCTSPASPPWTRIIPPR